MVNVHDQRQVHDLAFHACVAAVADAFPHLSIAAIIHPPHRWFDAALARQVVIHLMVRRFHIPKRRVTIMQERAREAVNRAVRTIDERLEDETFAAHYETVAQGADAYSQSDESEVA